MNSAISHFIDNTWSPPVVGQTLAADDAQLVLCYAAKAILQQPDIYDRVQARYPNAAIALCSTAGEIYQDMVFDDTLVATAMAFSHTRLATASVNISAFETSYDAAEQLARTLAADDLVYIMILSDGNLVNGSELVKGFKAGAGNVLVTGGLAGDGANFKSTLVGLNGPPEEGMIVAIGFYGNRLVVTHGSKGGWDGFGVEKTITRSDRNVLYEIEGENALEMYKKYLGPDAEHLPGSALLFPLSVTIPGIDRPIVRTILSIDEAAHSMTFAGDVPEGSTVRFMKADFDKLTAAAAMAAGQTIGNREQKPDLAILVSCVGRKLIYGPRIDAEIEAVCDTLGSNVPIAGFYSYGEISPFGEGGSCHLHNQTMTITAFYEL